MAQDQNTQTSEFLTFQLNGQDYSLDIMCVREIRSWAKPTPLPFAPSFMKGVINLRGTVLPVMDLSERLNMPARSNDERNVIVVVHHEDKMTGLMVDAVTDIIALSSTEMQQTNDVTPISNQMIKALTLHEDRMIRVLDISRIISATAHEAA